MATKPTTQEIFRKILSEDFIPQSILQPNRPPENTRADFTNYLLTHSFGQGKYAATGISKRAGAASEDPSLLSKIFGFLGSPVRIATGVAEGLSEPGDFGDKLADAGEGALAGLASIGTTGASLAQDITPPGWISKAFGYDIDDHLKGINKWENENAPQSFSHILDEHGVTNPWAKYGGGFALDVLLDPVTYATLGTGAVAKAGAAGREAKLASQGFRDSETVAKDAAHAEAVAKFDPRLVQKEPVPEFRLPKIGESAIGRNSIPIAGNEPSRIGFNPDALSRADSRYSNSGDRATDALSAMSDLATRRLGTSTDEVAYKGSLDRGLEPGETVRFNSPSFAVDDSIEDGLATASYFTNGTDPAVYRVIGGLKRRLPTGRKQENNEIYSNSTFEVVDKGTIKVTGDQHEVPLYTLREIQDTPETIGARVLQDPDSHAEMLKLRRQDKARRAAEVRWGRDPDLLDAPTWGPEQSAAFADMMRQRKMAKKGIVKDGKGQESAVAVNNVVQDIQNGELPLFGRNILPATGAAATKATEIATKLVQEVGKELGPKTQARLYSRIHDSLGELRLPKALQAVYQAGKAAGHLKPQEFNAWVDAQNLSRANSKLLKEYNDSETMAVRMLRTAEDRAIAMGAQPVYHNGIRVRLSDVLDDVPLSSRANIIDAFKSDSPTTNPWVEGAINKAQGRRAVVLSDFLNDAAKFTTAAKTQLEDAYGYPVAQRILKELPGEITDGLRQAGLSKAEIASIQDLMRNIVNVDKLAPEKVLEAAPEAIVNAVREGRINAKMATKLSGAIMKTLQLSHDEALNVVTGNKAVDTIMLRMSTYFGRQSEMKRVSQDVFGAGEAKAYARAEWLRNVVRGHTNEEIIHAFRLAQFPVLKGASGDPKVEALAAQFTDYFQRMLGSSGFKDMQDLAGTVAGRSTLVMNDVNKHLEALGSKFQFTASKHAKLDGAPRDYSDDGEGWIQSWEAADPRKSGQDPVSFLYDMDLALQRTVAEYSLYDDFGMRFGARASDKWFDPKIHQSAINHPRLTGLRFDPEVAKEFQRLMKDNETGAYRPHTKPTQYYSRALRIWKTNVTIYYPSHHVRNLVGDTWLMWGAGINDPKVFIKSARILWSQKRRYQAALKDPTLDALTGMIDADAAKWAMTTGGDTIINKAGQRLSAERLFHSAYERGLLRSVNSYEDIFGETPLGNLVNTSPRAEVYKKLSEPFGGKVHHTAAMIAEHREHYIRLAHYVGSIEKKLRKVKKSRPVNIEEIMDEAAHEVRKWHPDGTDLTVFEQKLRYAIPFYSWSRKSIPLMLQVLAQRPAKVLYYPKAQQALAGIAGTQNNGENNLIDPFPDSQLFPDWIRASGIGPIGDPGSDNPFAKFWGSLGAYELGTFGDKQGLTIVNPSNPFQDNVSQLLGMGQSPKDVLKGISNTLTPAAKIPIDLLSDTTFSGAPISKEEGGQGYADYFAQQVPQLSAAERLSGIGRNDRVTEKNTNRQNIINMLTALGIRGTGPYRTSAEFESRDRAKNGN